MSDRRYLVKEMFGPTLQGEGAHAGRAVVFLRFAACNLDCPGCDTDFDPQGAVRMGASDIVARLYALGIKPDWWKLEPSADDAAWANIVRAIETRDPLCRGVVMLGLSAPIPDLIASFKTAASFKLIKGFAVGRSIFHDVARDWLSGTMSDDEAVEVMASRLSALVQGWRTARESVEAAA